MEYLPTSVLTPRLQAFLVGSWPSTVFYGGATYALVCSEKVLKGSRITFLSHESNAGLRLVRITPIGSPR